MPYTFVKTFLLDAAVWVGMCCNLQHEAAWSRSNTNAAPRHQLALLLDVLTLAMPHSGSRLAPSEQSFRWT